MVQMIPHSQCHAVGARGLQIFSPSLLGVPYQNWQPNQETNFLLLPMLHLGTTHPTLSWWTQACLVACQGRHLLQEGFGLSSSPRLCGRGAGRDMIPPEGRWPWTEMWPLQA